MQEKGGTDTSGKNSRLDKLTEKINGKGCTDKTWWSLARNIYKPKKDVNESPLVENDRIIHDPMEKAEIFNQYFASMNDVKGSDDKVPGPIMVNPMAPGLKEMTFSSEDLKKAIRSMRTDSATGFDGVSYHALKMTSDSIAPYLTKLMNACMNAGIMPSSWKRANVSPIHQKGSISDKTNYRPISLLSCTSKLMERMVSDQLWAYLEGNSLLRPEQYGFRRGSSTLDQLLDIYDKMMTSLDNKMVMKLLFWTFQKRSTRSGMRVYGISWRYWESQDRY